MATSNSSHVQEIGALSSRLEWIDEERRKAIRKVAELEQRVTLQERERDGREERIRELERQVSTITAQMARLPQVDTKLQQFKDEIVQLIEQYDQRRLQAQDEVERLRRVEHEVHVRELADIRKELPAIGRLRDAMELRQSEEARLSQSIAAVQSKIPPIESRVETWESNLAYLSEAEKQNSRQISEVDVAILEINKRWEPLHARLDIMGTTISKFDGRLQELAKEFAEMRQSVKAYTEQVQAGEYQRNQKLEAWRTILDEQQDKIRRFSQEWVGFAEVFKEAKMTLQAMMEWQKQVEMRQKEAAELSRVEINRMIARWENFVSENEKRWRNFDVDAEQRWAAADRWDRQVQEQIAATEEMLEKMQQDKDLLWRVQAAQADALKQFPRLWLEEVEKAIAQNPNRRRQPALIPVRDEG